MNVPLSSDIHSTKGTRTQISCVVTIASSNCQNGAIPTKLSFLNEVTHVTDFRTTSNFWTDRYRKEEIIYLTTGGAVLIKMLEASLEFRILWQARRLLHKLLE